MSATPYGTNVPEGNRPKGLAIASLVLGLIGLVTSWLVLGGLVGLLAVILGIVALSKINKGLADGKGLAVAGIITGVVAILIAVIIAVAVGSFIGSDEFSNLTECLEAAGDNQSEIQECQEDFQRQINP